MPLTILTSLPIRRTAIGDGPESILQPGIVFENIRSRVVGYRRIGLKMAGICWEICQRVTN